MRLHHTYTTAPAIQPIRTPIQKLKAAGDVAAREASELRAAWERGDRHGTAGELLYSELRYAQGRADALAEAVELMGGRS